MRTPSKLKASDKRRRKESLRRRHGDGCYLCGRPMLFEQRYKWNWAYATLDHIVPGYMGGSNELTNLRLAHRACNEFRSTYQVNGDAGLSK